MLSPADLGGPKSPLNTLFVLANLESFDLGKSLSEQVMFQTKGDVGL